MEKFCDEPVLRGLFFAEMQFSLIITPHHTTDSIEYLCSYRNPDVYLEGYHEEMKAYEAQKGQNGEVRITTSHEISTHSQQNAAVVTEHQLPPPPLPVLLTASGVVPPGAVIPAAITGARRRLAPLDPSAQPPPLGQPLGYPIGVVQQQQQPQVQYPPPLVVVQPQGYPVTLNHQPQGVVAAVPQILQPQPAAKTTLTQIQQSASSSKKPPELIAKQRDASFNPQPVQLKTQESSSFIAPSNTGQNQIQPQYMGQQLLQPVQYSQAPPMVPLQTVAVPAVISGGSNNGITNDQTNAGRLEIHHYLHSDGETDSTLQTKADDQTHTVNIEVEHGNTNQKVTHKVTVAKSASIQQDAGQQPLQAAAVSAVPIIISGDNSNGVINNQPKAGRLDIHHYVNYGGAVKSEINKKSQDPVQIANTGDQSHTIQVDVEHPNGVTHSITHKMSTSPNTMTVKGVTGIKTTEEIHHEIAEGKHKRQPAEDRKSRYEDDFGDPKRQIRLDSNWWRDMMNSNGDLKRAEQITGETRCRPNTVKGSEFVSMQRPCGM